MQTIDTHAHYVPEDCLDIAVSPPASSSMTGNITNIDRRLSDMAATGVDIQAISAWNGFYSRDLAVAKRHNDSLAATVDKYPDKFIGLAIAPMAEPETAAAEVERSVKELGLRGVEIGSNVLGKNLDEPEFAPFFAKVQDLDVPVFIHPLNVLGPERLTRYHLDNLIGNVTDTAVAAASLIFGGVMKEYPRLKVYLAHGGGSCPYIRGRWDHGWQFRVKDHRIDKPPSEYLKSFYFDALTHSDQTLEFLVKFAGADRVMLGTDYPFDMGDREQVSWLRGLPFLSDGEKDGILGDNAAALFKL